MKVTNYVGNREPAYLLHRQIIEGISFRQKVVSLLYFTVSTMIMFVIIMRDTPSDTVCKLIVALNGVISIYSLLTLGGILRSEIKKIACLNKCYRENPGVISLRDYEEFENLFDGDNGCNEEDVEVINKS
jgi:hypothetical protein